MQVFTDKRARISVSIPDSWVGKRASSFVYRLGGDVAAFRSADNVLRLNIIVGSSHGIDILEQNRQLFRRYHTGSILKEGTVIVDGVEHFTGIYSKWGLIHKRYVIIKDRKEYAIACAARLETLDEFEKRAEPVFNNIVSSLEFL